MKFLLLVVAVLFVHDGIGQSLTLADLRKINTMSADEVETFLLKKNYELLKVDNTDSIKTTYTYGYNVSVDRSFVEKQVTLLFTLFARGVDYTATKSEYLEFKTAITNDGYKAETEPKLNGLNIPI